VFRIYREPGDIQVGINRRIDSFQEAQELLMAMGRVPLRDYGSLQHVQGSKQGGCPMALVIMGLPGRQTGP
jgi:hypothetical protein